MTLNEFYENLLGFSDIKIDTMVSQLSGSH